MTPNDTRFARKTNKFLVTGMDLVSPIDLLPPGKFPRLFNTRVKGAGTVEGRPGLHVLSAMVATGKPIQNIRRQTNDPTSLTQLLILSGGLVGGDGDVLTGNDGIGFAVRDSGYSGSPISTVLERPSDSESTFWMYIGDILKMRKVSSGNVVYQVGIDPPAAPPAVALNGAGNLVGTYTWRYRYRSDEGVRSVATDASAALTPNSEKVDVTLVASADPQVTKIDVFRQGGALTSYRFVGTTANVNGVFTDNSSDLDIASAEALDEDDFRPFQSVDSTGTAVRVDLPFLWGPMNGVIFAVGDNNRPGHLYWTKPYRPDSAPVTANLEITTGNEQLVNGFMWDGKSFVFSNERLFAIYPSFSTINSYQALETTCGRGLFSPWGFCLTPQGVAFLDRDGIYLSNGGPATSLSDADLYPLFPHESGQFWDFGKDTNGVRYPDMTIPQALRLEYADGKLYFDYIGNVDRAKHTLVYDFKVGGWFYDTYAQAIRMHHHDEGHAGPLGSLQASVALDSIYLGSDAGLIYRYDPAANDEGTNITCRVSTFAEDLGEPRVQKLWDDCFFEGDPAGMTFTITPKFDRETVSGVAVPVTGAGGILNKLVDLGDQLARNVNLDITWITGGPGNGHPVLYTWGPGGHVKPDDTEKRLIDWHEFIPDTDAYVRGIRLWVDTANQPKTVQVWADGANTGNTLTVTANGEREVVFNWPQFKGRLGRLVPTDTNRWRVTRWEWIKYPEPTLELDWDTNWRAFQEGGGIAYVTGLRIVADTLNVLKTIQLQTEYEGAVTNRIPTGFGGNPTLQHNGRLSHHFSFTPFRAEQYRISSSDGVLARLYDFGWISHPEPPVLQNWDATFRDFGKTALIKGVRVFADTANLPKTVNIEIEGVVQQAITMTHNGRQVIEYPLVPDGNGQWPKGKSVRLLPTDANFGFLYSVEYITTEEPTGISNWNSTYEDFGEDRIVKGVRIETDTLGAAKNVNVELDGTVYTALTVNHAIRDAVNYPLPTVANEFPRARTVRLRPTDANPGFLYSHRWIADREPFGLANWDAKWEYAAPGGAARFMQGCIITADTGGLDKTVRIEFEGGLGATLTINHAGRQGKGYSFDVPFIAHQIRARPTDVNAGWLYGVTWVSEPAPEIVTHWETQATDHDLQGYQHLRRGFIALESTDIVTLTIQRDAAPDIYTIPTTGGIYAKFPVIFKPLKGKTFAYKLTSPQPFRVFEKDCEIYVKPWGAEGPYSVVRPFGGPSRQVGAQI